VQARFGGGPTEKCLIRELAGGLAYHDRDEMEGLFTFLSERYERKSVMITTNLVFSEWERIFKKSNTTRDPTL
jgi:IstB-like ATP binding protein